MVDNKKVLLVGWDAADWKVINPLIDNGLMPNLAKLIENGVMGNLATLRPVFSPMLWTSIATGKRAYKHGIYGFTEPDPHGRGVRPITNLSRKSKAIWNILNQNGLRSNVVGWWPSHPAEPINGVMVSNHYQQPRGGLSDPWPLLPGCVHPERLRNPLADLRIHPHELTAEHLLPFVPLASRIDQEKDPRLLNLAKVISECSTIHAAATGIMQLEPWDFMAVYYDAIDHFSHGFMRYRPPKVDWVKDEDFEMYQGVVDGAYCYHDMMLGTLLKLVDEQTVIMLISDHGFHSDHLRPRVIPNEPAGPAAEHRDYGIFVLSGPGIRRDETVFGATLLDITPTILSLFGLPIGNDMDGRVLVSVFENEPDLEFVDSWEKIKGDSGQHPVDMQLDTAETRDSIRQLVELGYIDEPDEDLDKAARNSIRELDDNLARAYIDASRHLDAAQILGSLWEEWPEEIRFGVRLLRCYVELKEIELARKTLDKVRRQKAKFTAAARKELQELRAETEKEEESQKKPSRQELNRRRRLTARSKTNKHAIAFLEACVLELEQKDEEALKLLRAASSTDRANQAQVFRKMGDLYLKQRNWQAAADSFKKVLEIDPNDYHAMSGLSRYHLLLKDFEAAAEYARGSIGLVFHNPRAHYFHGLALYKMGNVDIAVKAIEMAIRQNENFPMAHRRLAFIYRRELGDEVQANYHRRQSAEARTRIGRFRPAINHKKTSVVDVETINQLSTTEKIGNLEVPPGEVINIVSGLPRSGTSMMMQMLTAGGMHPLTDRKRQSDENNPKGYFEYEKVKSLATDRSWVGEGKGQVLKVVAPLIAFLPPIYHYRFIFMIRPLTEVVDSQEKMLDRLGKRQTASNSSSVAEVYARQLQKAVRIATQNPLSEIIAVKYDDVLTKPLDTARRLSKFLQLDLDLERMAAVVDASLYRSRGTELDGELV